MEVGEVWRVRNGLCAEVASRLYLDDGYTYVCMIGEKADLGEPVTDHKKSAVMYKEDETLPVNGNKELELIKLID